VTSEQRVITVCSTRLPFSTFVDPTPLSFDFVNLGAIVIPTICSNSSF